MRVVPTCLMPNARLWSELVFTLEACLERPERMSKAVCGVLNVLRDAAEAEGFALALCDTSSSGATTAASSSCLLAKLCAALDQIFGCASPEVEPSSDLVLTASYLARFLTAYVLRCQRPLLQKVEEDVAERKNKNKKNGGGACCDCGAELLRCAVSATSRAMHIFLSSLEDDKKMGKKGNSRFEISPKKVALAFLLALIA